MFCVDQLITINGKQFFPEFVNDLKPTYKKAGNTYCVFHNGPCIHTIEGVVFNESFYDLADPKIVNVSDTGMVVKCSRDNIFLGKFSEPSYHGFPIKERWYFGIYKFHDADVEPFLQNDKFSLNGWDWEDSSQDYSELCPSGWKIFTEEIKIKGVEFCNGDYIKFPVNFDQVKIFRYFDEYYFLGVSKGFLYCEANIDLYLIYPRFLKKIFWLIISGLRKYLIPRPLCKYIVKTAFTKQKLKVKEFDIYRDKWVEEM